MKRSLLSFTVAALIGPAVMAADNAPSVIDLIDAGSNEILISVGAGGITFDGTNKIEFKITHSDDGTTFTPVAQADVIINGDAANLIVDASTGNVLALTTAHAAADVNRVSYVGAKRYIKVLVDFSGTHGSGTPINVLLVQHRLHLAGKTPV